MSLLSTVVCHCHHKSCCFILVQLVTVVNECPTHDTESGVRQLTVGHPVKKKHFLGWHLCHERHCSDQDSMKEV